MSGRRAPAALLAVIALLLTGCGAKREQIAPSGAQAVSVILDSRPSADHVGLYASFEHGEFRRAGLRVNVLTPSDPTTPLKLLAAGKVDLAIAHEPELLQARDAGAPLVAVGALVQRPLTSLISIGKGRPRGVAGLGGRTVGTTGLPFQAAFLKTFETEHHLSGVKQVDVGFGVIPAMVSKRVDATLGGFWNDEGIELRQRHRHPAVIPVDKAGIPIYDELVIVARRNTLREKGAIVRRFVQALGRGYADVRADPAAGVNALLAQVPALRTSRKLQDASVRATLPSFFPARTSRPFGFQDRAQWKAFGEWMFRHRLLKTEPHADFALTNEFLAGQGA